MSVESNSSTGGVEGSKMTFHCVNGSGTMVAVCMSDGNWSPNPQNMECHRYDRYNKHNPISK